MTGEPPMKPEIVANWTSIGMILGALDLTNTLRHIPTESLSRQIPNDWAEEQKQIRQIEELKQAEIRSGFSEKPKERTLSDGTTHVISGSPDVTAPPEAKAIGESLTASIRSRLGSQPSDLWFLDLGIALNRALDKADSRDSATRMGTVRPFRDFIDSAPHEIDKNLIAELNTLYAMMEKGVFTDNEKMVMSREFEKIMDFTMSR